MKNRARLQMICFIAGLLMIVIGVGLFLSKTSIETPFLKPDGSWGWWKILLVLLPLIAGIIMLIIKPHLRLSRIIAIAGVLVVFIVIFANMTIIVEKRIAPLEWVLYWVLMGGGLLVLISALFINRR